MREHFTKSAPLHGWIFLAAIVLLLPLASAGCASVNNLNNATRVSAVAACDASKVTVTGVHWFREDSGAWRVVGVINNQSSQAVSKVVTGVETMTSTGQPADQGEDVSAYPLDLQAGAQAPFTAWIDREIPGLDHFVVQVDECVLAEQIERGKLEVRGGRMVVDKTGTAQVTAELFNPGPQPVLVNGSMGAVYDNTGALVSADYAVVATRELAPGESGPVRAALALPPGQAQDLKTFKFFMDVLVNKPEPLPLDAGRNVQIISHYLDSSGHFHLLGQITNPGSTGLMASLQATVYSDSVRSSVVDAATYNTWLPLQPGETLPFDLTGWGALNNIPGLWDELAGQNAAIDLRIEPFLTWPVNAKVARLEVVDGRVSRNDQQVIFTGKVRNDQAGSINNALVTAVVRQSPGGAILATGSQHLAINDSAAPGQVLDYSLAVALPTTVDPASLQTEIVAMGQMP